MIDVASPIAADVHSSLPAAGGATALSGNRNVRNYLARAEDFPSFKEVLISSRRLPATTISLRVSMIEPGMLVEITAVGRAPVRA
jgi:hypothetical protein